MEQQLESSASPLKVGNTKFEEAVRMQECLASPHCCVDSILSQLTLCCLEQWCIAGWVPHAQECVLIPCVSLLVILSYLSPKDMSWRCSDHICHQVQTDIA